MDSDSYINIQRVYKNKLGSLEEKKRKIKLFTLGGTLITASALVAELVLGALAKPTDVKYYFNSDNVSITQLDSEDYTTKIYNAVDNQGLFNTFTFENLEEIEPHEHGGYTSIPGEYLPEKSSLGIRREENNPIRVTCNLAAFGTLLAGATVVGISDYRKRSIENEEEIIKGRSR